jgi:RNA polymerase sigma-70 factor (ECF subfamily)
MKSILPPEDDTMGSIQDAFFLELQAEIPHLRRYAQALTRCRENADDLTQTVLERALTNSARFRSGTHLRRWLFTIARNAYRDERRLLARHGDHMSIGDWLEEAQGLSPQEKHLELAEVANRIARLRPEDRVVLELRVFSGLSTRQIAMTMGVAVGTVKSRLSRARQALAI